MIEKMLRDHDRLRECAARLRLLLDSSSPCDMAELSRTRWDLASTLMQHLAFEDRHLYTRLASDPRASISAIGLEFQTSLRAKFLEYAEHAKSWTPDRITADWRGYRVTAMKMMSYCMVRIDREERELYPLLEPAGIDTTMPMMTAIGWTRDAFAIKDQINGAGPG